jgi:hypothetical protein
MKKHLVIPFLLFVSLVAFGCVEEDTDSAFDTTGIMLTVDIDGNTDVTSMRFEVYPGELDPDGACINTGEEPFTATADLEDLHLPAAVNGNEFAVRTDHLFADRFFTLPAGCYNIVVQPLAADTDLSRCHHDCPSAPVESADCARAEGTADVADGLTTEVLLISQCAGDPVGGLDVAAALNHPPVIDIGSLEYDRSKIVFECERTVICVSATDDDDDPLVYEWEQLGGPPLSIELMPQRPNCVRVVPHDVGEYWMEVTVRDVMADGTPVEDALVPAGTSRDTLAFPLYADNDPAFLCYDPSQWFQLVPKDGLIDQIDRPTWCECQFNIFAYQLCEDWRQGC